MWFVFENKISDDNRALVVLFLRFALCGWFYAAWLDEKIVSGEKHLKVCFKVFGLYFSSTVPFGANNCACQAKRAFSASYEEKVNPAARRFKVFCVVNCTYSHILKALFTIAWIFSVLRLRNDRLKVNDTQTPFTFLVEARSVFGNEFE